MKAIIKLWFKLSLLIFCATLLQVGPVLAHCPEEETEPGQELDFKYKYYEVEGNTYNELFEDVSKKGPAGGDGKIWPGLTNFSYNYSYAYGYSYERVTIDGRNGVKINLTFNNVVMTKEVTVTMPKLKEGVALDETNTRYWRDFIENLDKHERDHVIISMDKNIENRYKSEMNSIKEIIFEHPSDEDISGDLISKKVSERADVIHKELTQQVQDVNDKLDKITEHGLKPFDREIFFGWAKYYITCEKF